MSRKIYNKNLTFLQDQPFAENLSTGSCYKKSKVQVSSRRDSSLPMHLHKIVSQASGAHSFSRNKSEKMRKAEASLVLHFCSVLERDIEGYMPNSSMDLSKQTSNQVININSGYSSRLHDKVGHSTPHLLVCVDVMRNTLLSIRSSRSSERVKTPSQFKKTLRECRKIRLLYGNLSKRHLSRATSKMRIPGENLLIWLESRLDVVLERCGFFATIKAARQSVLNGEILVNSKVVRSPGFVLGKGDFIKIIQHKVNTESFNTHLSERQRGTVLSNQLLSLSEINKNLLFSAFRSLSQCKGGEKRVDKGLSLPRKEQSSNLVHFGIHPSTGVSQDPVLGFFPYKSFYTWLLDQNPEQLNQKLRSLKLDSQNKVLASDQTTCSAQNWRFLGSPHLVSSLFYSHAYLQRIISSKTSRGENPLLNISEIEPFFLLLGEFFSQNHSSDTKNNSPSTRKETSKGEENSNPGRIRGLTSGIIHSSSSPTFVTVGGSSKGRASPNLLWAQSLQNSSGQSSLITRVHHLFGESHTRAVIDVYKNLLRLSESKPNFTMQTQSLLDKSTRELGKAGCEVGTPVNLNKQVSKGILHPNSLGKGDIESTTNSITLLLAKDRPSPEQDQARSVQVKPGSLLFKQLALNLLKSTKRSLLIKNQKDLMRMLFFDLGLYSLLLKKETRKKINLNQGSNFGQERRLKPLHLEVSYKSLCAVYLYPPQRVCLPVMIDVHCLAKAF